jgi:hypothetical protein
MVAPGARLELLAGLAELGWVYEGKLKIKSNTHSLNEHRHPTVSFGFFQSCFLEQ